MIEKINQNPKNVEVLVAATTPVVWEAVLRHHTATQKQNSADMDYIAFFRVRIPDDRGILRSAITHIAKIKSADNNASISEWFRKNPRIREYSEEIGKGWEKSTYHKEYYLEEIKELPKPILCRKGEGRRCQVKLYTTLDELNKAAYLGDIRTLWQLQGDITSKI